MKNREAVKSIIKAVLLAFILLRPFIDGLTYPIQNSIFHLVVISLVVIWLCSFFWQKGETFLLLKSPPDLPLLLFLLFLLVSSSFSSCHYLSFHLSLQFIGYFLLYWLVVNNIEEKEVKGFLIIILFSATLISLYGIYQYFWGLEATRKFIATHYRMEELPEALLSRLSSNRVFSTFVYPNILAGYLIMLFPIGMTMAIESRHFFKPIFLGICALLLYCLFYTKSVGGWIGLFFILGFFLIFYFFKEGKKILFFGGLFLSLFLLIFFLFFKFGGLPHLSAFRDRIGYWSAGFRMIKENPFFGSGPGTFGSRFARYKLAYTMETQHAHNNFLEIWVETGVFGLLLFLWIWGNFFRAAVKRIIQRNKSVGRRLSQIHTDDTRCHPECKAKGLLLKERFFPRIEYGVRMTFLRLSASKRGNSLILLGLSLAIFGSLIHSFGDFDLYDPSLATIIFFILALAVVMLKDTRPYRIKKSVLTKTALFLIIGMVILSGGMNLREILAERKAKQAVQLMNEEKFKEGRVMLQKALFWQSTNPSYWYRLAEVDQKIALIQRDSLAWERAIEEMKRAIFFNPYPAYYHYTLAKLYWIKGIREGKESLLEKAIAQLKEAVNRYPTKSIYHLELGKLYEFLGEEERAKKEYKEAEKWNRLFRSESEN